MIQTQISPTGILYLAYFLETNIFQNHSLFFGFINSTIELSAYIVHLQGLWVRSWEGMVGPSLVITRITSHKYSARNYDNFRGITPPRLPGVAWLRGHCPAHTTLEMCPLLQTESCMEPSHSSHSKNYAIATSPSTMLTWLFNQINSPASIEGFIYFEGCPKIHLV